VLVRRDSGGQEHILIRSAAVRAAIDGLPSYALASAILRLVPRPISDLGYAIFSRYRKLIFGSQNVCDVIKPPDRELFLE
jgi:predicted DCC family thiol-disulfide oxidoreductase YuxK